MMQPFGMYEKPMEKKGIGIGEKHIFIFFVVLTVSILVGGVVMLSNTTSTAAQIVVSNNAKVQTTEKDYDFGQKPINGGNITKSFTIKNTGSDVLQLANVKTSCHCTKASIKIENEVSPFFGMSGVSSWLGEVKPGQTAAIVVIFDPAFHGPTGAGSINRYISVDTNDASNRTVTFSLNGVVTK